MPGISPCACRRRRRCSSTPGTDRRCRSPCPRPRSTAPNRRSVARCLRQGAAETRASYLRPCTSPPASLVVPARQDDVDLITAIGTVFVIPQVARYRVHDQPQRIAMSHRINFRLVPGASSEGIVGRHRPVVAQTHDFSAMTVRISRSVAIGSAVRHINHAVPAEAMRELYPFASSGSQSATKMSRTSVRAPFPGGRAPAPSRSVCCDPTCRPVCCR